LLAVFFPGEAVVRVPIEALVVLFTRPLLRRLMARRRMRYHRKC
jgi:hypothetical protein